MNLAGMIDHTLLKADATEKDIVRLCHEAKEYHFASVCVNPTYVPVAAKLLYGTGIGVAAVIGFPLGASLTESKIQEVMAVKALGAREADVVMNIGWAKSGAWDKVERDISRVVECAHCCGMLIKVIIETALLSDEEKSRAAEIVVRSGADYIKTSTGFAGGGATVEDVKQLKTLVGDKIKIKAAGGIRTKEFAAALAEAGADRLGTSAGVGLVQ